MKKGIGEKVLGWFIVEESDDGASEAAPREVGGEEAEATEVTAVKAVVTSPATREVRPSAGAERPRLVLAEAPSLADDDRERLGRVLSLLDHLPAEATPDVKRAIVGASLEAFGVRIEGIVASSQRAIAALDAFAESTRKKSADAASEADARIAALNQEIAAIRRASEAERATSNDAIRGAGAERARLEAALAFFQR